MGDAAVLTDEERYEWLVSGGTYYHVTRDDDGRIVRMERIDPRLVRPRIRPAGRPYIGTIALIAWAAYWVGIVWAVAAGRLP